MSKLIISYYKIKKYVPLGWACKVEKSCCKWLSFMTQSCISIQALDNHAHFRLMPQPWWRRVKDGKAHAVFMLSLLYLGISLSGEKTKRCISISNPSAVSLELLSSWTVRIRPGTTSLSWQQRKVGTRNHAGWALITRKLVCQDSLCNKRLVHSRRNGLQLALLFENRSPSRCCESNSAGMLIVKDRTSKHTRNSSLRKENCGYLLTPHGVWNPCDFLSSVNREKWRLLVVGGGGGSRSTVKYH